MKVFLLFNLPKNNYKQMEESLILFKEGIYTQKELNYFLNLHPIESVNRLREGLALQKYYCNNVLALKLVIDYDLRQRALMFSGDAGAGKTSLALALSKHYQTKLYRLDCYKGITEERAIYKYNQHLQDLKVERLFKHNPNPTDEEINKVLYDFKNVSFGPLGKAFIENNDDCFVLINEIDKIPPEEGFEATLLTYLDEYMFIISELNLEIRPQTKKNPLVMITSNAGTQHGGSSITGSNGDGVKMLSYPLQRRGTHLHLKSPNMARMFQIVSNLAPKLPAKIIKHIILYVARLGFFRNTTDSSMRDSPIGLSQSRLEKPIGTSEIIDWAKSIEWLHLQYQNVPILQKGVLLAVFVALTLERLAKTESDQNQLLSGLTDDIRQVYEAQWDVEKAIEDLQKEDSGIEEKEYYDNKQL